jgi:hypothetical protein
MNFLRLYKGRALQPPGWIQFQHKAALLICLRNDSARALYREEKKLSDLLIAADFIFQ